MSWPVPYPAVASLSYTGTLAQTKCPSSPASNLKYGKILLNFTLFYLTLEPYKEEQWSRLKCSHSPVFPTGNQKAMEGEKPQLPYQKTFCSPRDISLFPVQVIARDPSALHIERNHRFLKCAFGGQHIKCSFLKIIPNQSCIVWTICEENTSYNFTLKEMLGLSKSILAHAY